MSSRLIGTSLLLAALILGAPSGASAQTCYTATSLGGASTPTLVTAIERVGTTPSNMNALENDGQDASSYAVANFVGVATVTAATALVSGSIADNDHAPLGLTFINGSASAVTVTQVDVTSDRAKPALFRSAPKPVGLGPLTGWDWVDGWTIRWSGAIVVPPKSGQGFIVDANISNERLDITNVNVGGVITTSIGSFTGQAFPTDVFVPDRKWKVATAVVGFEVAGTFPHTFVPGLTGGVSNTISVRVEEYANTQSIASGLQLEVSVPEQWTSVSLVSAPAPWNAASVVIQQPTSSSPGFIRISTNQVIDKGGVTPPFQFSATPPTVFSASTFLMRASLSGFDTSLPPHPIRSVCDGGGSIGTAPGGGGGAGVEVEFLSPSLTPHAPVLETVLSADFNVSDGVGGETISFEVFNVTTSSWETISTAAPGPAPNAAATRTFADTAIPDYLDASNRMRIRFRSVATTQPHTLRVDRLQWTSNLGWVVDNALGSDVFPGNARAPLATVEAALATVSGSEAIYVRVGNSRAGQPYGPNLSLTAASAAGTAACKTLVQGIADASGNGPLIIGVDPNADHGFAAFVDHVKLDGFEVRNSNVGLYAAQGTSGIVLSNSVVEVPASGFGILGYESPGARFEGNRIRATAPNAMVGLWDFGGSGTILRGNAATGFSGGGIGLWSWGTAAPRIERNIASGNYIGLQVSHTTGVAEVFNNTADSNGYMGIYAESPASLSGRNNIVTRNWMGWRWNGSGAVQTSYDDVWSNNTNYVGMTGSSSISADPLFTQTSDPSLATFYRPSPGSPCIDAGIDVGLPFLGAAPDIGAIEVQ
jgi:hypothetical protein